MKLRKLICSLMCVGTFCLVGCDEKPVYSANTRFLYSTNAGLNWSETIQEIEVGTNYYLAIEMQVSQSKESKKENTVVAKITIPNTDVLECHLDDHPGISITGDYDPINEKITYSFNLAAGVNPIKFRAIFDCVPLSAGKATIYVEYDDKVSSNWDYSGTIKYVDPIQPGSEESNIE